MNVTMQRRLFILAAIVECLAGLAFFVAPGATIAALFGAEPHREGLMIGRLAGVALLSLGIACWGARADPGGAARLLVGFAATGQAGGLAPWGAGILHLGIASAFAVALLRKAAATTNS
jgi:hypothetical protein